MVIKKARPTRRLLVGHVASPKSAVLLKWRGIAERTLFQLLDIDPEVLTIQPRVTAKSAGGVTIHTFAALVRGRDQYYFVDVVPDGPLPSKLGMACGQMMQAGLAFRLYRHNDLLAPPVLGNLTRLRRVRRASPSPEAVVCLDCFSGQWPTSMAELVDHIGSEREVDALIVHGYLRVDLLHQLVGSSLVHRLQRGVGYDA